MRKLICGLGVLGAVVLAQAGSIQPAAAEVVYPWCAHYWGRGMGGAPSCGFVSYRQCMATVSGLGGYCAENPFYVPPPRAGRYMRVQ